MKNFDNKLFKADTAGGSGMPRCQACKGQLLRACSQLAGLFLVEHSNRTAHKRKMANQDIGTTLIRLLVFDENGQQVKHL